MLYCLYITLCMWYHVYMYCSVCLVVLYIMYVCICTVVRVCTHAPCMYYTGMHKRMCLHAYVTEWLLCIYELNNYVTCLCSVYVCAVEHLLIIINHVALWYQVKGNTSSQTVIPMQKLVSHISSTCKIK